MTQPVYLIERYYENSIQYFNCCGERGVTGAGEPPRGWARDPNEAMQFARRVDANVALKYLCGNVGRVVEHLWVDKP